ncbi:MAG: hypothetical protein WD552_01475 [Candidatus Paceibacterota bacterium]
MDAVSSEQITSTTLPINEVDGAVKRRPEVGTTVHELEIEKRQLIPNGRRNCHCLQSGMKRGNIVLLVRTKEVRTEEEQEWIIFFPAGNKNLLPPLTYLTFHGIGEKDDGNEVAVRAEAIEARGYSSLKELLLGIKEPRQTVEEILDEETGKVAAFYIS